MWATTTSTPPLLSSLGLGHLSEQLLIAGHCSASAELPFFCAHEKKRWRRLASVAGGNDFFGEDLSLCALIDELGDVISKAQQDREQR